MKHVPMPDHVYLLSIIDYASDTGLFTWKIKRGSVNPGTPAGYFNLNYYSIEIDRKVYQLHRLAYYYVTGIDPAELEIDHVNGNKLDNRFNNLRLATRLNQTQNKKMPSHNQSGYKGVSWRKSAKKWRAYITVSKKQIHLGYFDDPYEASLVYQAAAAEYFGDFKRPQNLE